MGDVGVDQQLAAWTIDYLTSRAQQVRLQHWASEVVVVCSTGAPHGAELSPFLFSLRIRPQTQL